MRFLRSILVLAIGSTLLWGADEPVLTGMLKVGKTPRAYFLLGSGGKTFDLAVGEEWAGYRLESVNFAKKEATLTEGNQRFTVKFANPTNSAPGAAHGHSAAGRTRELAMRRHEQIQQEMATHRVLETLAQNGGIPGSIPTNGPALTANGTPVFGITQEAIADAVAAQRKQEDEDQDYRSKYGYEAWIDMVARREAVGADAAGTNGILPAPTARDPRDH